MTLLLRLLLNGLALMLVAYLYSGVQVDGIFPALMAALLLGLVNAVIRPVLVILTFPLTLLTLGLFLLVLNGFCLTLTAWFVPGFDVHGFLPAVLGALLVTIVSWLLTAFVSDRGRVERYRY